MKFYQAVFRDLDPEFLSLAIAIEPYKSRDLTPCHLSAWIRLWKNEQKSITNGAT